MCKFCAKIFTITVVGFLFLIFTLSYVGVMISYIAIPTIIVCGFLSSWGECYNSFSKKDAEKLEKLCTENKSFLSTNIRDNENKNKLDIPPV